MLSVRCWRPLKQELLVAADVVIKRNSTVSQLRQFLAESVLKKAGAPAVDTAVPFNVGLVKLLLPLEPKTPTSKILSLPWNDPEV